MALQVTFGAGSLVAAGVEAGDIATLVTLGHRFGNWITAEKGDAEFLALIEESEFGILRRRGLIDKLRFQARWGRRLRLLENGRPQRFDGQPVERLLCSSSQWTVMMTCIVAALDEFASSSMVRNICKAFLQRLLSAQDGIGIVQDLIDSSVQIRVNGWRSAATVREMNIACRKIRDDLLRQGLVVQGFMPVAETHEVIDFLYWLLAQETEVFRTSSSDIAAIASCLCHLSFESLTIENFGVSSTRETNCRLVYDKAPLYCSDGRVVADTRQRMACRELSTTVSLTQPEETFSTFPISHETANRCRVAWELGSTAGSHVNLGPCESTGSGFTHNDLIMTFRNKGTSISNQSRKDSGPWRLASLLAIFSTEEVNGGLTEVLGRENPNSLFRIAEFIKGGSVSRERMPESAINEPTILEPFTVCQAFFMGYYYQIFSQVVDASTLEIQTVTGCWGYQSPEFLRRINKHFQGMNGLYSGSDKNLFSMTRTDVLSLIATLYANMDVKIPKGDFSTRALSHQELCVGVVGKRMILANSLVNNCETLEDIFRFVILDCDSGGVPRTWEGLVLTGIPSQFSTWDGETPETESNVVLSGSKEDCTRHIEANWDGLPERMVLCIRYNGRRVGSLNPIHADIAFCMAFIRPSTESATSKAFGPAHSCLLDDFVISSRLVTSGRFDPDVPVVVHMKGNPCLRYAAAAWYSDVCDVVLVNNSLQQAFGHWKSGKGVSSSSSHDFVALVG